MAVLGNNANLDPMIVALEEHIHAASTALDRFRAAQAERNRLTVAKDDGSGHTDLEITTSTDKFITLADVAEANATFTAAKDIFTDPNPV
jgi:hypothetical protein